MDYKQLRRILRERLDASGAPSDETHSHAAEESPVSVQELPAHDLPVNIAALIGDELVEPPVNDSEFIPGNLQQLQHATNVLVQQVPPLQVQDFYHKLRRLITTSIRQQNRAGENANSVMPEPSPDQQIAQADQAAPEEQDVVAENIRRIIRAQVNEHKVRKVVRRALTEQYNDNEYGDEPVDDDEDDEFIPVDMPSSPDDAKKRASAQALKLLQDEDFIGDGGIFPRHPAYKLISKLVGADRQAFFLVNPHLDPKSSKKSPKTDIVKKRAASGKTGSEEVPLDDIAQYLSREGISMGVSAIRNILGRFNEDLGISYFFDKKGNVLKDRKDAHRSVWNNIVKSFQLVFKMGTNVILLEQLLSKENIEYFSREYANENLSGTQIGNLLKDMQRDLGKDILNDPGLKEKSRFIFTAVLDSVFGKTTTLGKQSSLPGYAKKFRDEEFQDMGVDVPAAQSKYTATMKGLPTEIASSWENIKGLLSQEDKDLADVVSQLLIDLIDGAVGYNDAEEEVDWEMPSSSANDSKPVAARKARLIDMPSRYLDMYKKGSASFDTGVGKAAAKALKQNKN